MKKLKVFFLMASEEGLFKKNGISGKFYFLAISMVLAIWFSLGEWQWLALALLIGLVILLSRKQLFMAVLAMMTAVFSIVNSLYISPNHSIFKEPFQGTFEGKIIDLPKFDGDRLTFTMKLHEGEKLAVHHRIKHSDEKQSLMSHLKTGLTCTINGQLQQPPAKDNFHAFNYQKYLFHQGIHWLLQTETDFTCGDQTLTLLDRLHRLREQKINEVEKHFPKPSSDMINALVFGYRDNINQEILNAYQMLGIIHLLAVSGLHISVVIGSLYYLGRRLGFIREHVIFLMIILIPLYICLTGASPSVVRAGLMALSVFCAQLFKSKISALDSISITCMSMLVYQPHLLFNLGFELSFLVTFFILLSSPFIDKKYNSFLLKLIAVTSIAQLASFPIIVYHFYDFSLMSFLVNLFFIPFITFCILPFCFIAFFVFWLFPFLLPYVINPLQAALIYSDKWLLLLYRCHFLNLRFGQPSILFLIFTCICIASVCYWWEASKRKSAIMGPVILIIALYFCQSCLGYLNPCGKVTFLNVGQGDSILIQLPHRKGNILIDAGGYLPFQKQKWQKRKNPFEPGRDVVLNELKGYGVKRLDAVILTHEDYDHIGGLKDIAGKMPIKNLIVSPYFPIEGSKKALIIKCLKEGTAIKTVEANDTLKFGHYFFRVLSPASKMSSSNGNSVVLAARLGGEMWLFTGDGDKEAEQDLLNRYTHLNIDILKAGHHGSKTSTSERFIKKIKPKAAIISAGKNNRYGHPHSEVLERLKKQRVKIFRTDERGAVEVTFKGHHIAKLITAE
ncbi:competence protein ComEC [Scopulibacillus daqui]|uniref:Competence protein ComEC n=1 Tax=Scopulibacillus daqui TaxID=1469162 RepID=A0ABS2Q1J1_9BACL|nr:DNA internalization-related competence protein ComEC/Rec2 [Scopulibacillus daqui]MBM7645820.1 competence protein ComEC [Scopulibacillus daqui]